MKILDSYCQGKWFEPQGDLLDVINPATEAAIAQVRLGTAYDADKAVQAARQAFPVYSQRPIQARIDDLKRIRQLYEARMPEIAAAISAEMGAPMSFAMDAQAWSGLAHLGAHIEALEQFEFETMRGKTRVVREAIGVAALITPWNWPMNQIVCKVAPALAAGCTVVLKPSEIAPLSAQIFAEIMHAADLPEGVFNMVHGDGQGVGQTLACHPEVDVVSFTGSTLAGIAVAKAAADTVKRVTQELGGKSANIILPDADFEHAVREGSKLCFANSGQSCDAPTRMLVPRARHDEAVAIAQAVAASCKVGDPLDASTEMGPVVSARQFDRIQKCIQTGIEQGAHLVCGGLGRPAHLAQGYFVQPTIFSQVHTNMAIARDEVFGPVLAIMPYDTEEEAIQIANDSPYGLAAYVQSGDAQHAERVGRQLRAGQVQINYPDWDLHAPFGGYKQSGNGREYGEWGIHDFLEMKALIAS